MVKELPKRLSYEDAAFLNMERDSSPMNVGSVGVYEGVIPFPTFMSHVERRIDQIPRYRQRLVPAPFGLVHPAWVDDPHFDITRHLRVVTLPAPGGHAELRDLAAKFFAEPLSRDKPLWEILLVHGLGGHRTAHVAKVHHCLVDGVAGIELLAALLDLEPKPPAVRRREQHRKPPPLPSRDALVVDAVIDRLNEQARTNTEIAQAIVNPLQGVRTLQSIVRAFRVVGGYLATAAPRTPWNREITSPSRLAWASVPFADVHDIAKRLDGKINDVVLTALAGALSRFLDELGEPTDGVTLRAACPVNVRDEASAELGNRVSFMLIGLPMSVHDHTKRFRRIHGESEAMKKAEQAAGIDALLRLLGQLPAAYQAVVAGGLSTPNPISNLVCTNVPGPLQPLYMMTHRMIEHYPWVPLGWRMGLAVAVMSYDTSLWFGIVADEGVPGDLERLAAHLRDSFDEMHETAEVPAEFAKDTAATEAIGAQALSESVPTA
jgi:WS/DGAT/MGAT family acyltransferase